MFSLLIVDDESIIREGISRRRIWRELGIFYVKTAGSAKEARAIILKSRPNIVFTDLVMPVEDGFELMRFIRNNAPETQIIVLSAYSEFSYATEAMQLGARGYITKPTDDEQIRTIFTDVVNDLRRERRYASEAAEYTPLVPVLDHIHLHYAEHISLEEAATIAAMNPSYFSDRFSKTMGQSFVDYVNQTRVEHAKLLLRQTNNRVQKVGELVGFRDNAYFCRVFRKFAGVSPGEWRGGPTL